MAKPPEQPQSDPQTDALFREVDEDLRHEALHKFWKRYGVLIVAAALLVVVAVAAGQGWKAWQASQRAEEAAVYEEAKAALDAGETDKALSILATLSADADSGFAPVAALSRAEALVKAGRTEEAIAVWRDLADTGTADPLFRDAARVLAGLHGLDILPPAEVDALVAPVRDGTGPWQAMGAELSALAALADGRTEDAVYQLQVLTNDPQAPGGVRGRAAELLAAMGEPTDMPAPPGAETPAETGTPESTGAPAESAPAENAPTGTGTEGNGNG